VADTNRESGNNISLASVKEVLQAWRQNKTTRGEKIPLYLWDLIINLVQGHNGKESKLLAELGITRAQMDAETQRRQSLTTSEQSNEDDLEALEFCQVNKAQEPSYPLAYKPAESFSTATSVVEIYRKDGALMKIHICTERFDELLSAFFSGCE